MRYPYEKEIHNLSTHLASHPIFAGELKRFILDSYYDHQDLLLKATPIMCLNYLFIDSCDRVHSCKCITILVSCRIGFHKGKENCRFWL